MTWRNVTHTFVALALVSVGLTMAVWFSQMWSTDTPLLKVLTFVFVVGSISLIMRAVQKLM